MNPLKRRIASTDYNSIARYYNFITQVVSGGGNARAQQFFLDYVKPDDEALHIGCGSVAFNRELAGICRKVVAIDIANEMIEIGKKKNHSKNVEFICTDIMDYSPDTQYDVVFANFFLNTFQWNDALKVMVHIKKFVKPNGLLCIADETRATKLSTKISIFLFRPLIEWIHHIWAGQPRHHIYDYRPTLRQLGFNAIVSKRDKNDYILSTLYRIGE